MQLLEWDNLHNHVVATERLHRGIAMTFALDVADDVEGLAAREAECCSFLSIATTRGEDSIRLEITSDDLAARPVIEMLTGASGR